MSALRTLIRKPSFLKGLSFWFKLGSSRQPLPLPKVKACFGRQRCFGIKTASNFLKLFDTYFFDICSLLLLRNPAAIESSLLDPNSAEIIFFKSGTDLNSHPRINLVYLYIGAVHCVLTVST